MKSQQQRALHSGVPMSFNVPKTRLAPLEEVVDRVNNAVEVTTREFQCLTSWLLHRGDQRNMATESHQTQPRTKWEGCSRNPN
jgi:hypothetical protein